MTKNKAHWELILYLWHRRLILVCALAVSIVFGGLYCWLAPRTYVANAMLFPKEASLKSSESLLAASGLSLNLFQNNALNRLEVLFSSEEVAEQVLREENLLPILFSGEWNAEREIWKGEPPHIRKATRELRAHITVGADIRKQFLDVSVSAPTPELALRILSAYLRAVNDKVRRDAKNEAHTNRVFLEEQLRGTDDPILRAKIESLIVSQIENMMYMSASSFHMPDEPRLPVFPERPRKALVMVLSIFLGLVGGVGGLLGIWIVRRLKDDFTSIYG